MVEVIDIFPEFFSFAGYVGEVRIMGQYVR